VTKKEQFFAVVVCFFVALEFELRASYLQNRHSTI
jgi:hypothetical protein